MYDRSFYLLPNFKLKYFFNKSSTNGRLVHSASKPYRFRCLELTLAVKKQYSLEIWPCRKNLEFSKSEVAVLFGSKVFHHNLNSRLLMVH